MGVKKWYLGVIAAVLLMCAMVCPAVAAEADGAAESYTAEQEVGGTEELYTAKHETGGTEELYAAEQETDEAEELCVAEQRLVQADADVLYGETDGDDTGEDNPGDADSTTTVAVTGLTLDHTKYTAHVAGETLQLTATVTPTEATDLTVAWTSSNDSVAAVDENGLVTITGGGNAVITATAGDYSAACTISTSLYSGIYEAPDGNGWFYYKNGEVDTSRTDVIHCTVKGEYAWWYFEKGQVSFTETVAKNSNGWWYIRNGKVDFTYTGFAQNKNGWWYLESGKVTFKKNSVIKDKTGALGTKGTWWYVVGSKVQTDFTGLADYSNENGWWYIEDGKVTFTKNTVAKNKNGWWYVVGSKVQFGFTGLANYSNANGWWYIKNGKVDFTYAGIAKNKNGQWYLKNGKVQFGYTGYYTSGDTVYTIKKGKVKSSGSYIWPLPGNTTITSGYGYRICPYHGYEFHGGIDIAAAKGTSILACADGTVVATGTSSSKGKYIEIDHGNGVTTTYWHCNSIAVKKGQTVKLGQVIGTVGKTGNATGYHLDLRFLLDGEYVSPLNYVTPV